MALEQFQLRLRSSIDDGTPTMQMKVFVLRMCRMNRDAWKALEEKCGEFMIGKGVIAPAHQYDAIQLHMEAVGVWMRPVISNERKPQHQITPQQWITDGHRLFWEQRRCYHMIIAEPFIDIVMETLNAIPRNMRAAPRETGEFIIRDYAFTLPDDMALYIKDKIGELWAVVG
jgi:hypothetical protein